MDSSSKKVIIFLLGASAGNEIFALRKRGANGEEIFPGEFPKNPRKKFVVEIGAV